MSHISFLVTQTYSLVRQQFCLWELGFSSQGRKKCLCRGSVKGMLCRKQSLCDRTKSQVTFLSQSLLFLGVRFETSSELILGVLILISVCLKHSGDCTSAQISTVVPCYPQCRQATLAVWLHLENREMPPPRLGTGRGFLGRSAPSEPAEATPSLQGPSKELATALQIYRKIGYILKC